MLAYNRAHYRVRWSLGRFSQQFCGGAVDPAPQPMTMALSLLRRSSPASSPPPSHSQLHSPESSWKNITKSTTQHVWPVGYRKRRRDGAPRTRHAHQPACPPPSYGRSKTARRHREYRTRTWAARRWRDVPWPLLLHHSLPYSHQLLHFPLSLLVGQRHII